MFTHLHLHTEFSLLDGLSRIPQLMERARDLGQEAIGLTDHGVLYGALQFYREARASGIKPIIGVEAYVAKESRLLRDPSEKQPYHMTLLAKNELGYRNLMAASTKAHLEGFFYKPRMDREVLEQHSEGLIALSGCNSSHISRLLQADQYDEAGAAARYYRDIFNGDFYIELQEHAIEDMIPLNQKLVRLARDLDLPLVATNDVHYVQHDDWAMQDILLCIGTNSTVSDEKRMRMAGHSDSYYLKSEAEMLELFPELPEAVHNTWKVADKCNLTIEFGRIHLPGADVPDGLTSAEHLRNLCYEGLHRRYSGRLEEAQRRLDYELGVIDVTDFTDYILIVYDLARHAREQGILFAIRGSAAASIVLYCLGVTDIDPIEHRLVFERFIHEERREMPDVDMDFAEDRRDEMIRYTARKYGTDRVAQIITFGTLGAKASLRDVGRALGMPYADVDRVVRLVPSLPPSFGVVTIDRALEESSDLRQVYEADSQVQRLIGTAKQLEGVSRHSSTHAAGVVIAPQPLVNYLPLQRPANGDANALPTTQYAMNDVAALGLLKMDFLGLTNLTILGVAIEVIRQTRGAEIDLSRLPEGDAKTYDMLSVGETFGVFQLESAGMRRYIQELKPNSIRDLAAMVALYRPGPMQHIPTYIRAKHGLEPIRYPHADLAEILDETYGVIVYQDQVLLIAQKFAGYSLGQADVMRKAMGKKIRAVMSAEEERFIKGAVALGYDRKLAHTIFDLIEPFAGYAFNKAHAVSYGTIAYQTAYLKANYPEEYMTAVLMMAHNHPVGQAKRVAEAYSECLRLGIGVLPPDVNRSQGNFALERQDDGTQASRFGLESIKNVGEAMVEAILETRESGGPFLGIEDFFQRVPVSSLNKRALESMIKAGAFDSLTERGGLLDALDRLLTLAQRAQKIKETGQATLFDLLGQTDSASLPAVELANIDVPLTRRLAWEKELLGVYLSEHPFARAAVALAAQVTSLMAEVDEELIGRDAVLAGYVAQTRLLNTRDGRTFLAVELEDLSGALEVTVWPDTYEQTRDLWQHGNIVVATVRVRSRGDDRLQLSVQKAALYQEALPGPQDPAPVRRRSASPEQPRGRATPKSAAAASAGRTAVAVQPANDPSLDPSPTRGGTEERWNGERGGIRVVVEESDNADADQERLRAVVNTLREFQGGDEVRLSIRERDGSEVDLQLPKARACPELDQRLRDVLGAWGSVSI